jgi:superfamily II DNA/RNA helicase
MTFQELNLNKQLLNALEDLGLTTPTPIQEQVFSVVIRGKPLLIYCLAFASLYFPRKNIRNC